MTPRAPQASEWMGTTEARAALGVSLELRSVERNLIVKVEPAEDGPRYRLLTRPLRDMVRNGQVDPFTPVMTTDERLEVTGAGTVALDANGTLRRLPETLCG